MLLPQQFNNYQSSTINSHIKNSSYTNRQVKICTSYYYQYDSNPFRCFYFALVLPCFDIKKSRNAIQQLIYPIPLYHIVKHLIGWQYFKKSSIQFLKFFHNLKMAYSALIEGLDRLTVKSVLRGSTATIIGIIGTLSVIILCLVFYIPPTSSVIKGEYIETQFHTRKFIKTQFYSNDDFKLAIVFRNRITNSIANHSQILDYGLAIASEYLGASYSKNYYQLAPQCKDSPNYFTGVKDFMAPQDCFIFPQYSLFNVFKERGWYSYLYFNIYAQDDPDPFASAGGGLAGFQGRIAKLLEDYYYEVLFTSKVINPKGETEMVMNSFYSSQSEPTSLVRTTWTDVFFTVKNTTMDVSILPWNNYQTKSYISWNGQFFTSRLFGEISASKNGVEVGFAPSDDNINSYRYYKKIDLIIGYIGGAMLLFYLILWVPFNYINKTIHQIRNTRSLLLIVKNKKQNQHELRKLPLTDDDVVAATPNICLYFLSNFLTNLLSKSIRSEYQLVMQAQRQLDIVALVKKLKITERNLKKHNLYKNFKEKLLCFGEKNEATEMQSISISESDRSNIVANNDDILLEDVYLDQDFKEDIVDGKYQLTENQRVFLRERANIKELYSINQTAMIIVEDQNGSAELREINSKKKYTDQDKEQKRGIINSIGRFISAIFEFFDLFGAKPNLIGTPHGSSFVGLLTIILIITLTSLTVGVTLSLRNTAQIQTVEQFQDENNHSIQLTPSVDFNLIVCSSYISYLEGSNRYANFRFFYENEKGRTYYSPSRLTSLDYQLFEISESESPINIQYCYAWKSDQSFSIGKTPESEGHIGFRFQPYCASTPSYCTSYSNSTMNSFLLFMNNADIITFFPQNRFDPENKRLVGNLVYKSLNINRFYMNENAAMEQTIFLDAARVLDDTENYFARKQPTILEQGFTLNPNTPQPISKMFPSSIIFHQLKVKHSTLSYNYLLSTTKTDNILALIGGVLVIWYALCHWLAKAYNNYCVRTAHADAIYGEGLAHDYFIKKLLAISPIPLCLIPQSYNIRNQITRMRLVDKKVVNELNYLWLIKTINNVFNLSTYPLKRNEEKHLSMVFVKQKINQSDEVHPQYARPVQANNQDFIELRDDGQNQIEQKMLGKKNNKNKVFNESNANLQKMNDTAGIAMTQSLQQKTLQKIKIQHQQQQQARIPSQTKEYFDDNYYNGQQKPMPLGWLDTFQYPASLTYKGKREVTSCVGGCFSILLMVLIVVVANFELKVYFDGGDAKTGKTTSVMQPLQSQSNETFNSRIYLQTGTDFKLAVTFSTLKYDVFQNISQYMNNGTGISVFQKKLIRNNGIISTTTFQYPLIPCPQGYLTDSLSSIIDKTYFTNQQYGYCIPDGLRLEISGLPQDPQRHSFTLSIYNKLNTDAGRDNIRALLNNYYPKFHYTVPNKDFNKQEITYQITSLLFDPYNITQPVQQNISLTKTFITYDNRIGFSEEPQTVQTYNVNAFQQNDASYSGLVTETLYYNLTFDNSFLVEHYTLRDDKFYQTFGIIGGLIAFFIFGFGCIPRAYNNYRMKYLIGRELYLFDMSREKMKKNAARGRKKKSTKQAQQMQQINQINEFNIFRAFILSYIGGIMQNYNFDEVLRRVTIIQQRVEKDINLIEVYRKIHSFKESINQKHQNSYCDVTSLFLKPIYNDTPQQSNLQGVLLSKIDGYSRKNNWTEFQRQSVYRAFENGVRLRDVFDNKFLQKQFNLRQDQTDNASRIQQTQIAPTNSIFQSSSRKEDFSQLDA